MDVEDDALYGREKAIAPMNCRRNKTANSAAGFIMTGFVRAIPSRFNVTMAVKSKRSSGYFFDRSAVVPDLTII